MSNDITPTPAIVDELADMLGGKVHDVVIHPGGESGSAVISFALPEDHWIYEKSEKGWSTTHEHEPPLLIPGHSMVRDYLDEKVKIAARYGVKCATMDGEEDDFDPDALVRNVQNGLLGYFTRDGAMTPLSHNVGDPPPPWTPARLPGVLMEAVRLCIAEGYLSYNDVVGGVQPEAVAKSVQAHEERMAENHRRAQEWMAERGIVTEEYTPAPTENSTDGNV